MRLVFCGTPEFALPSFRHLLGQSHFETVAVFTQPDRPRGRGHELSSPPIKQAALAAAIPVHQPERIRAPEVQTLLEELAPDAIVIIAYGQIIPARLLPIPKFGWINLHASLLPKYRGAAPINWAIVNGDTSTGVTTMRIDAGMDTGQMLLQQDLEIARHETAPQLAARLAELGAPLMAETLRRLAAGSITPCPQPSAGASLAPRLKREDGRIAWSLSATEIFNRIRGFTPWPGAFTSFRGQTCHIWGQPMHDHAEKNSTPAGLAKEPAKPGAILVQGPAAFVCCGGATHLQLTAIKLEGRKQVSASEFLHGAHLRSDERFGES